MAKYAEGTTVSAEQSRAEIERTLTRFGAASFAYGWSGERAQLQFVAHGRAIRFTLALPARDDPTFTRYQRGEFSTPVARSEAEATKRWEAECRRRWRSLALVVKAKLEAVSTGIATFEDEFLAYTVLPDGSTFGAWAQPQIDRAYEGGAMPPMLALGSGA